MWAPGSRRSASASAPGFGCWALGLDFRSRPLIQQLKDPFRRGHCGLQRVELLGHVADWPEESSRVQEERDERSERQACRSARSRRRTRGSAPRRSSPRTRRPAETPRSRKSARRSRRGAGVDVVEPRVVDRLAPEQLHRRHAVDVLVQEGVDARDPRAAPSGTTRARCCGTTAPAPR